MSATDEQHAYLPEGDEEYFHTENDEAHQAQQSPASPLVLASQGLTAEVGVVAGTAFDGWTNEQLRNEITARGIETDGQLAKLNKTALLAALGE
jgi:hypothetical protein